MIALRFTRRCTIAGSLVGIVLVAGWSGRGEGPDANQAFDPTDRYEVRQVEGWTVLVNKGFLAGDPDLAGRTLSLLRDQLFQVTRKVPASALAKLRRVRIWVEQAQAAPLCATYHHEVGWLREHAKNPDKVRCVEIGNARTFLAWTLDQPWMILHELAHAYHDQFLPDGFDNLEIRDAYAGAMKAKQYASVLHFDGKVKAAYATENPREYFAEGSEAFFGTNDFFPFVRAELQRHDPALDSLLSAVWHRR
jgi:hypothetical protein